MIKNDYRLYVSLIPRSSKHDCLPNKVHRERFGTCSCDAHCSWDLCRSSIPPSECLLDTDLTWELDSVKNAWVAQLLRGNRSTKGCSFNKKLSKLNYTNMAWYIISTLKGMKWNGRLHCHYKIPLIFRLHSQWQMIGLQNPKELLAKVMREKVNKSSFETCLHFVR